MSTATRDDGVKYVVNDRQLPACRLLLRHLQQRLVEAGAMASVGSVGDSYDNALAEAFAEYIDWYNHRRLHGELGLIPPAEHEANHHNTTAPVSITSG